MCLDTSVKHNLHYRICVIMYQYDSIGSWLAKQLTIKSVVILQGVTMGATGSVVELAISSAPANSTANSNIKEMGPSLYLNLGFNLLSGSLPTNEILHTGCCARNHYLLELGFIRYLAFDKVHMFRRGRGMHLFMS